MSKGNTVNIGRERLVLCVSEKTLLPIILPLKGGHLPERLREALTDTLRALGVPEQGRKSERKAMAEVAYAKTASRVILGTMNDFQFAMPYHRPHEPSLLALGLKLSETPCSPLNYDAPDTATRAAFGVAKEPRSR